jgi:nucleoid-associated protein YgaU
MTRETKIGLLVGLAFIIVIGILLSDHMTSTTQPPQAQLAEVAPNVRESVGTPAPANPGPAAVTSLTPITPANPVLSQVELRPPTPAAPTAPAVTHVQIGGPTAPQQQAATPIAIHQTESPIVPQAQDQQQQRPAEPPAPAEPTAAGQDSAADAGTSTLERWANKLGEPIVPVKPTAPAQGPVAVGPTKEYTAQAGDSLSRIASRVMGANTKANRDAIVKANAGLQKNPELIIEGHKYQIPETVKTAASPAEPAPGAIPAEASARPAKAKTKAIPVTELVETLPASTPAPGGGNFYVVKENDTLWKIANEQLGSANAWRQIKDMNKDTLKGSDIVHVNMRLRLPPKPLASAN